MKNIFTKKNLMPLIVLSSICLIVAALMGGINMLTAPKIAFNEEQKVYDSLRQVLDGTFETLEIPSSAPSTVTGLFKVSDENGEFKGNVVTVEQKGYAGKILLTIGFDKDGKTTKVVITAQSESHGKDINPLLDRLSGISSDAVSDVEVVTGATISSGYIKSAVSDAFKAIGQNDGENDGGEEEAEQLPKTDEELEALVKSFVGEDVEITNVTPEEKNSFVKRVYSLSKNKGYVAYVYSINERYGVVDTENLVHIGKDNTIKNIMKLTWSVSDAAPEYGYNPPSADRLDQLYNDLAGKNTNNIGDVDLVTGATNTTTTLVNTLNEALKVVGEILKKDLPRAESEIKELASELVGTDAVLTNVDLDEANSYVKLVYRVSGNKGYVAYVYSINERYGVVDTENLVHIGTDGAIKNIMKLTWSVSDAVPEYGYNPPNADRLDQLYNDLAGKNTNNIGDVDLVTGATNTTTTLVNTLNEALKVVGELLKKDLPRAESEIKEFASELVGGGVQLTDITPDYVCKYIKRIYLVSDNKGYVAYVHSVNERYGNIDTENLVHIGTDGAIKNIMKLTWSVSDAMPEYGYNPPSADRLDQLYNDFNGKNTDNIGDVDLVTGATNTATVLKDSLVEALEKVKYYIENSSDAAKEAALLSRMEKLAPNAKGFEKMSLPENAASTLKALYKVLGFDGYVAYVITSTQYVDVETEALVYINAKGEVANIDLMTWTVGHGIEPGDFAQSLIGKSADELKDVELVTAATVTAGNLRDAVVDAINVIPMNYTPTIIGAVVMALSAVAAVAVIIIKRRKNG